MIETALLFLGQITHIGTDRRHCTEKWGKNRDQDLHKGYGAYESDSTQ